MGEIVKIGTATFLICHNYYNLYYKQKGMAKT